MAWRDAPGVRASEADLSSETELRFAALKALCDAPGSGGGVEEQLEHLLGSWKDLEIELGPQRVTKQIVFCNALMKNEGLSLLQSIIMGGETQQPKMGKGAKKYSEKCGRLAAELMERTVPLIYSS